MRVAILTETLLPDCNGAARSVDTLVRHLADDGHEVTIVGPARIGTCDSLPPSVRFVPVPSLRLWRAPFSLALTTMGSHRRINSVMGTNFDVLHAHGPGPMSLYAARLSRKFQTPLVLTFHTDLLQYATYYPLLSALMRPVMSLLAWQLRRSLKQEKTPRLPSIQRLIFLTAAASRYVIFPSGKTAAAYAHLMPGNKAVVCPTGMDYHEPDLQRTRVQRTPGPSDTKRLLFVGRLSAEKNVSLLLDAFDRLIDQGRAVELMLVGPIVDRHIAKRLLASCPGGRIVACGQVDNKDIWTYYRQADVLVFPSLSDTQGLVLLEAAYSGLPVVIVDHLLSVDPRVGSEAQAYEGAIFSNPTARDLADSIVGVLARTSDNVWLEGVWKSGREIARGNSARGYVTRTTEIYEAARSTPAGRPSA